MEQTSGQPRPVIRQRRLPSRAEFDVESANVPRSPVALDTCLRDGASYQKDVYSFGSRARVFSAALHPRRGRKWSARTATDHRSRRLPRPREYRVRAGRGDNPPAVSPQDDSFIRVHQNARSRVPVRRRRPSGVPADRQWRSAVVAGSIHLAGAGWGPHVCLAPGPWVRRDQDGSRKRVSRQPCSGHRGVHPGLLPPVGRCDGDEAGAKRRRGPDGCRGPQPRELPRAPAEAGRIRVQAGVSEGFRGQIGPGPLPSP